VSQQSWQRSNSYTFESEVADPKGGWATVMEGKATRAAAGN
jgi:hypothetical protein